MLLTFEETARLAEAFAREGFSKISITRREPAHGCSKRGGGTAPCGISCKV
jgi:hypothetical protein